MSRLARRLKTAAKLPVATVRALAAWRGRRGKVRNWLGLWAISNPLRSALGRRSRGEEILIEFQDGMRIAVDGSMSDSVASFTETYDEYMRNLGISLRQGDVVVDVGAHVGTFCIPAAYRTAGSRVIAFEPDPGNFEVLSRNAARNPLVADRLTLRNLAVAGVEGQLRFSRGLTSTTGSLADAGFYREQQDAETVVVSATTLGQVFADAAVDRCRLLKLDCEGSEYEIFAKLPDALLARIENMIVEAHPARGGSPDELAAHLRRKGFTVTPRAHRNGCADLYCRRDT